MKKVRKAIIPVAGLGTRFLPVTKSIPKEMLPIVDTPTLQYIIEEAAAAGIEEILLITKWNKGCIEDHFDTNYELESILERDGKFKELVLVKTPSRLVKLYYIRQDEPKGSGHAINIGRSFVGAEPFAVLYGDDLMYSTEEPVLKQLINDYEETGANVIGTKEVTESEVSRYGMIKFKNEYTRQIDTIVEKPSVGEQPSLVAGLGRYVVRSTIFDCLDRISTGAGGEYQFTDAMKMLMETEDFYACNIDGTYYDTGSKIGYLKANIDFALRRPELKDELTKYINELK